jgi:predicted HTH transcriptional regulator
MNIARKNRFSKLWKEPSPASFQTGMKLFSMSKSKNEREYSRRVNRLRKQSILHLARQKGSISRKEVEDLVGLKTTKAFRLLKELCDEGQLTQQVSGKFTRYIPSTM